MSKPKHRNHAKPMVMTPKFASSTIAPDKGKGSYNRADQMDWIYEYQPMDDANELDTDTGWISHTSGNRTNAGG